MKHAINCIRKFRLARGFRTWREVAGLLKEAQRMKAIQLAKAARSRAQAYGTTTATTETTMLKLDQLKKAETISTPKEAALQPTKTDSSCQTAPALEPTPVIQHEQQQEVHTVVHHVHTPPPCPPFGWFEEDSVWELLPPHLNHFWNVDVFQRPPVLPMMPSPQSAGMMQRRRREMVPLMGPQDDFDEAKRSASSRFALMARLRDLDQVEGEVRQMQGLPLEPQYPGQQQQQQQQEQVPCQTRTCHTPKREEDVRTIQMEEVCGAAFAHLMANAMATLSNQPCYSSFHTS